jgi:hypothetical protein
MSKRRDVQASSPFSEILSRHQSVPSETTVTQPAAASRARGKSADPNFIKLTTYIRKETHQAVKIDLLKDGQGREFSELVQELLDGWLNRR